ncbi:DUF4157 domain-containing protein [Chloracidobacterium validum]|uniref:DUF4157 domain-containing protein n=1 Tax=Chloracidobacterium validum TaxID=2821543 RepID=A0ABX8BCG5_9BACT|nr:DUF4157 domain-containing protein [Chloracidobacterium validum]QUW04614.1 DUF4157 domain-containing protein [Chloracidobacterium validum]
MWTSLRLLLTGLGGWSWEGPPPPGWRHLPSATRQQLQPFFPELDLDDILWRVDGVPWWVRRLAVIPPLAITLGSLVWVAPNQYAPETPAGIELIAHELAHVAQYRRHGYVGFTVRYGLAFVSNLWRGDGLAAAYENICFEIEARARATAICQQLLFV